MGASPPYGGSMATLQAILWRISRVGSVLAGAGLITGMLLVTASVTARFFSSSVAGSYELTQLAISVTIVFGLAYTGLQRGHIVVEVVVQRFHPKVRGASAVFVSLLTIGFWVLVAWAGARFALDTGLGETSETLDVPYLPFRVLLAVGALLLSLTYVSTVAAGYRRMKGE